MPTPFGTTLFGTPTGVRRFRYADLVRAIFADSEPGWHWTVEEAMKANEAALGPNLLTNVDFNNWTPGSDVTVDSATTVTSTQPSRGISKLGVFDVGGWYRISVSMTNSGSMQVVNDVAPTPLLTNMPSAESPGTRVVWFQAVTSALYFRYAAAGTFTLDGISVQKIDMRKCQAFQDSAGTIPVYAMEQPLGLILDTSRGLVRGSELVVNGDFSAGSAGWGLFNGWAVSGGVVSAVSGTNGDAVYRSDAALIPGRWYQVSYEILAISAGAISSKLSGVNGTQRSTVGAHTDILLATINTPYVGFRVHGTTTATVDNISVKELPGNHFYQTDPTKRPTVTRRVNLLTATTGQVAGAYPWSGNALGVLQPDGSTLVSRHSTTSNSYADQPVSGLQPGRYVAQLAVKSSGVAPKYGLRVQGAYPSRVDVVVDLANGSIVGTVGSTGFEVVSASVSEPDADGFVTVRVELTANQAPLRVIHGPTGAGTAVGGWEGVVAEPCAAYARNPDFRLASDALASMPTYQAVRSPTDYDEVDFPAGAKFNGLNTFLLSGEVDMTATDEVLLAVSLAKADDIRSTVLETSGSSATSEGSIAVFSALTEGQKQLSFRSGGTVPGITSSWSGRPDKSVLVGIAKISAPSVSLVVNGSSASANTSDQGSGNYGNHRVYVGMRLGISLPFNGIIYGMTAVGKLQTTSRLKALENMHRRIGKIY